MKMMNKVGALLLSAVLCIVMAAPAFAYGGDVTEEVEQPVLSLQRFPVDKSKAGKHNRPVSENNVAARQ